MGLLRKVAGETKGELMEDGFRGSPDVDLSGYAASRGLDFRGQKSQLGYLAAFPWAEELMFNVMRGDLPGGERGVLLHEVKLLDDDAPGTFYGVKEKTAGFKGWHLLPGAGLFSQSWNYFRAPHTTAAVRIPEATGPSTASMSPAAPSATAAAATTGSPTTSTRRDGGRCRASEPIRRSSSGCFSARSRRSSPSRASTASRSPSSTGSSSSSSRTS